MCPLFKYQYSRGVTGFYLISFWYKREESQRRFTVFWSSVLFASMFGGLLASAIANMQGVRGYSSWRWVFILEGIATIVIGIVAYFLVADFPTDASWLSAEEREFVIARTATDDGSASPVTVRKVVSFFGSVKNILGGFMYFGKLYTCTCLRELWLTFIRRRHCPNILCVPLAFTQYRTN